jgi:2-dehydrotetronate isomerase
LPRFAANLTLLFTERPYGARFAAAARAGFAGVEVLFPYLESLHVTAGALAETGRQLVLMNAPFPDSATGTLGCAATPGAEALFRVEMTRILATAEALNPGLVHVMSGDGRGARAEDTFVGNLRWLADRAPMRRFTIEPLNARDRPDYLLNSYDLATEVLDRVDRPNIGLQYDTYHAQMITGDALAVWRDFRDRVTHVQIASAPERREPGVGDFDFPDFFAELDASGYEGWVSAEYHPTGRTEDTLGWMPRSR